MHRPRRVERAEHFTELARGQGLLHFLVGVFSLVFMAHSLMLFAFAT